MRRKRELTFRKNTKIVNFQKADNIWESTYEYECINSIFIALFIMNEIGYTKVVDWDFNDFGESHVLLKCTKEEFIDFAKKFMEEFKNDIHDIKF